MKDQSKGVYITREDKKERGRNIVGGFGYNVQIVCTI